MSLSYIRVQCLIALVWSTRVKPSFRQLRCLGGKPSGAGVYPHEDVHVALAMYKRAFKNFFTSVSNLPFRIDFMEILMAKRHSTEDRLRKLAQQKTQIDAQIAALDARRRLSQKKDENRLKWLLGNLIFDRLSAEPGLQELVRRDLPERLTQRDRDRELWQILFPYTHGGRS